MRTPIQSPFLSIPEVCGYLHMSRATLYRKIASGEMAKPARRGGRALYRREYIEGVADKLRLVAIDAELGL